MTPEGASSVTVEHSEEQGTPVVRIAGDLDVSSIDTAQAAVDTIPDSGDHGIIFDLEGLTFMDSSGLALLLKAWARFGHVLIRRPSPLIRQVIEMTGLTSSLPIE